MSLAPAITDIEQLKDRPQLARLLAWNAGAVDGAKFDRDELTVWIKREFIVDAIRFLRAADDLKLDYLCDITCVDWYPREPRFEVVYHLLSLPNKTNPDKSRLRIKVKLEGSDPRIQSITSEFPSANFFEREVFDLFGVHFEGHPYLRRIMMPEDWQGHPLRKDYPVEGYR
jgi:NADH-quinone oxidoreductase subunit C